MGTLTFINGMFVAAAAAALVPIIIHLVQRRRVQRVVFGSVRFLRKMSQRVVRRRRLTELLLIILRALAIAVLAFAFARPFLWRRGDRKGGSTILGEEIALVVVDNSYSMRAAKRLEKAKKLALEYLDDVDPDVKVGVARFSSQFHVLSPIGSSIDQARDAVEKIEQSWEGTDLFLALEQAEARLVARPEEARHIILISDFQKTSWRFAGTGGGRDENDAEGPGKDPKARPRIDWKLKPGIRLNIKDVGEEDAEQLEARRKQEAERRKKEEQQRKTEEEKRRRDQEQAKARSAGTKPADEKSEDEAKKREADRKKREADRRRSEAARRRREREVRQEVQNIFVERVAVPRLVVAGGFAEVISAKIVNRTAKPLNNADVVLRIGEREVNKKQVNIRPNAETPVRFRHVFKEPGDVIGSIHVEARDKLPDDDVAYFCVHVTPRVRVLLVNGDPNDQLNRNDGFFISKALVPGTEDVTSPFEVREVVPAALKPDDMKGVNAVIFTNVDSIPARNMPGMKQFVADGGGVAFFCGPEMDGEKFNASLAELAPCKLFQLGRKEGDDPVAVSLVDMKHEIFREFSGPRRGDFATAQFTQYYQVTESQAAKVLARFNNWHPALLEKRIGKGKSLLFVSAADLEWNNLCIKSVFAPFIHELTRRLCGEQAAGNRNLIVGERIVHRVPLEVDKVELLTPDGKKREIDAVGSGKDADAERMVGFTPDRPGVYQMVYKGGPARFSVNIDPDEPDPVRLDTKVLLSSVQSDPTAEVKQVASTEAVLAKSTARERAEGQQKFWWYLVGLVLVVLAAEMVLAAKAGTG